MGGAGGAACGGGGAPYPPTPEYMFVSPPIGGAIPYGFADGGGCIRDGAPYGDGGCGSADDKSDEN